MFSSASIFSQFSAISISSKFSFVSSNSSFSFASSNSHARYFNNGKFFDLAKLGLKGLSESKNPVEALIETAKPVTKPVEDIFKPKGLLGGLFKSKNPLEKALEGIGK